MFKINPTLTHKQVVTRLYRQYLRTLSDWAPSKQDFLDAAWFTRQEFNRYKGETDPKVVQNFITKTSERLEYIKHPLPYKVPTMPDGTMWERNIQIPERFIVAGERDINREFGRFRTEINEDATRAAYYFPNLSKAIRRIFNLEPSPTPIQKVHHDAHDHHATPHSHGHH